MDMSSAGGWGQAAGTIFQTYGNLSSARAAQAQGNSQQAAYQFEAAQLRQNATNAAAAGENAAAEERRQGELIQSRAIALAAASGGSTTDPSIAALLSRNAGETAYKANVALYNGLSREHALLLQAVGADTSGVNAAVAGADRANSFRTKAFSDLLSSQSATSLFRRFSGDQAPAPVSDATSTPVVQQP